ncbi:hypothetical protein [Paenibacillus sp. LK1]|uniref:hypothetical protein n=1 Tax=Paenibacillus sp. LK1 TaxID=2053014 RepID=UPI000C1834F4|nr:hypothetical protein [Paenibacillus sp. LK1]PIH59084.1 hypothetical protein CS562_14165 [Paenibacillus sp. LK1]
MYLEYDEESYQSFESSFMSLVNTEVEKRVNEYLDELHSLREVNRLSEQKIIELTQTNKKPEQMKLFEVLKSKITLDNISVLIAHLNLESSSVDFEGMHKDEIPQWFKLIVKYYPDKDIIFALFDLFDIEYPLWAKSYKLPYDYNESELDMIFSNLYKMYVCNGCIFEHNMGFHFSSVSRYKGNLKNLFEKESYVEIPWNLLLQNPLLTQDKYFKLIYDSILNKKSHSEYFFKIQDYQNISTSQSKELFKLIPTKNLKEIHKNFVKKNSYLLKFNTELSELFKDQMTENQYGHFYYLDFQYPQQKAFIMQRNIRMDKKIEMICKLNIPKEEKIKFISELADQTIEDIESDFSNDTI